jgi:hypothetical protein
MSSRRQQIVDAVKTRFAAITVENEFDTNLGNSLHEWRTEQFEDSELPGINLRDESEPVSYASKSSGSVLRQLKIGADLVFQEEDVSASLARAGLADVERAIALDPSWGGLARLTIMNESRLMTDERGIWLGGARITFTIEYFTKPFEP